MLGSAWAAPIALIPIPENDACRRPSHSQAPAMRRAARTAKPQGHIPEHEASFQTRGPDRSRRRREHERRISRSNKKGPGLPGWARLNAPFPALGAGWGAGLRASGGPRARGAPAARGQARFQRAVSPVGAAGRRSRARPAAPSEAVHAPLVGVQDTRIDRIRQDDRHDLIGVSADQLERPLCGMKIVPPMLLQFAVGVKRLRIWVKPARRRRGPLDQADVRNAMMAGLNGESRPRPNASHDDDTVLAVCDNIELTPGFIGIVVVQLICLVWAGCPNH